jgi:hypothetical protein
MRLPVKRRKKSEMHYVWLYDIYRKRNSEKRAMMLRTRVIMTAAGKGERV